MYSIEEVVKAARIQFGISPALMEAALRATGKQRFTYEEARELVRKIGMRKVEK